MELVLKTKCNVSNVCINYHYPYYYCDFNNALSSVKYSLSSSQLDNNNKNTG